MTSIIITYHNEGKEFLQECIRQIKKTIDFSEYEIIVVDDCSDVPLTGIKEKIIRHDVNRGVGISFDTGVKEAKGEIIFLTACDMRFVNNGWAGKLKAVVENNKKSLVCTSCVGLKEGHMDFEKRREILRTYGATILAYHDKTTDKKKDDGFRNIIEAKWDRKKEGVYELPCILGACYGVTKEWYNYIDGFWGHKKWGTLEPYISLKSWMFGGNCLCASEIETAHIFKDIKGHYHGTRQDEIIYNKVLVSKLFCDGHYDKLISFLGNSSLVLKTKDSINKDSVILEKKNEYKGKTVLPFDDYCKKFNIELR